MSKWKCEICNSEFDNYQAQGFNGIIYCPLCYFKELYKREKQEKDQLTNNWNELEEWIMQDVKDEKPDLYFQVLRKVDILDKMNEIKERNK